MDPNLTRYTAVESDEESSLLSSKTCGSDELELPGANSYEAFFKTPQNAIDGRNNNDDDSDTIGNLDSDSDTSLGSHAGDLNSRPAIERTKDITAAWSSKTLMTAYIFMWLIFFVEGLLSGTTTMLVPYITSDFALHSFTPTVNILSSVVGGVTNLTLVKVLDVFGRPHGLLLCLLVAMVGFILMAASRGITSFAVAHVFQTGGNTGIQYCLSVLVADSSSLRNRGLLQALVTSPNMITCWLAGHVASSFLEGPGWRWMFLTNLVLVPLVTIPLLVLLFRADSTRAIRSGSPTHQVEGDGDRLKEQLARRISLKRFMYYMRHFDSIGVALLLVGLGLVLLALNLSPLHGPGSLRVITALVLGLAVMGAFAVWEKRYATVSFMPFSLLRDRTIVGACVLSAVLFMSYWSWNSFFSSYLQVVHDLSVSTANIVVQLYTVCSVLSAMLIGVLIRETGRFKQLCLYFGVAISAIGTILMMQFCKAHQPVGYIIFCQTLISIAAGTVMICSEVAILAAAGSRQSSAVCLAVLGLFANLGGAIGLTVSSSIWQSVFPARLRDYLPDDRLGDLNKIIADISTQLSYPVQSATRIAIQHAYSDAQVFMLTFSAVAWVIGLLAVLSWKDINVMDSD